MPSERIPAAAGLPVGWAEKWLRADKQYASGVLAVVFPDGERLGAAIMAVEGSEHLLTRFQPLRPVASPPDFVVWDAQGTVAAGFFDPTWKTIVP